MYICCIIGFSTTTRLLHHTVVPKIRFPASKTLGQVKFSMLGGSPVGKIPA